MNWLAIKTGVPLVNGHGAGDYRGIFCKIHLDCLTGKLVKHHKFLKTISQLFLITDPELHGP